MVSVAVADNLDYPHNVHEFITRFATETACRDYLEAIRWCNGFVCPRCGVLGNSWRMSDGLLRCRACRARTSVTAGTMLDKTRYPLTTWLRVMWYVTGPETVSARDLQRKFGLGSYQTAWTWMRKLRQAMAHPGHDVTTEPGAYTHGLLFYCLCERVAATSLS